MSDNKVREFYAALGCINRIDDLFEYRYENYTPEELRETVQSYLADFTRRLEELSGVPTKGESK